MSRYTGPRVKLLRALGVDLPGLTRKSLEKRPHPPGQHGPKKLNARKSEYGAQLIEKQKLRYNYGVNETQLRRIVLEARRHRGATGEKLIELLERRLDNLVFRAGFAATIPAARQLIRHGHIDLNGCRATIPSITVRVGESFGPRPKARNLDPVKDALSQPSLERPEWIAFDEAECRATLTHLPAGDAVPFPLNIQHIVEFYATRL